jgi:ubiquitin fusion degradation protein 1
MVMEVKPSDAVSIIECDMNVDFAPPVGYKEPQREESKKAPEPVGEVVTDGAAVPDEQFRAFTGEGQRLDGRKPRQLPAIVPVSDNSTKRGIPNYDYKKGKLTFPKGSLRPTEAEKVESEEVCKQFVASVLFDVLSCMSRV